MTIKDSKYVKTNSANHSYLIFSKLNGHFEEINKSKYIAQVSTNERKGKIKKYERLWSKIRDLIREITKTSDNYDEKYKKIWFNSDVKLILNKMIEILIMIIVFRAVYHENNKYYQHVFLDESLYELQII